MRTLAPALLVITYAWVSAHHHGAQAARQWPHAKSDSARCAVIGAWTERFLAEYPGSQADLPLAEVESRLANLFLDADFTPYFTQSFAGLDRRARRSIGQAVTRCASGGGTPGLNADVARPLAGLLTDDDRAVRVQALVRARQSAQETVDTLRQQLAVLSIGPGAFPDALTLKEGTIARLAGHWPSSLRRLDAELGGLVGPFADAALAAWVADVTEAARHDGSAAMARAALQQLDVPRGAAGLEIILDYASPDGRERARAALQTLETELLELELSAMARELESMGIGLPALQAGMAWHDRFTQRFASHRRLDSVEAAFTRFRTRRHQDIRQSSRDLLARIRSAKTVADVDSVIATFVGLDSDRQDEAMQPILAEASQRRMALTAAAAQAEKEARSAAAICRTRSTSTPRGTREPSERDMCLVLAREIDALNEELLRTERQCRAGGFDRNPMLAMRCLGLCGGTGGTCSLSVQLTSFRKLACGEALRAESGFYCDYAMDLSASNALINEISSAFGGLGGVTQARFVRTARGWIKLK